MVKWNESGVFVLLAVAQCISTVANCLAPDTKHAFRAVMVWMSAAAKLKKMGQKKLTMEEKKIRRRALKDRNLPSFQQHIQEQ